MKKLISLSCLFAMSIGMFAQQPAATGDSSQQLEQKKLCLAATITAINLEIVNYQRWIDQRKQKDTQNELDELQKSMELLNVDFKKYQAMDAKDYILPDGKTANDDFFSHTFTPQKICTAGWVDGKADKNTILNVDGMSKSGPWFHLAGIVGNDYSILQPNTHYQLVFYTVYKRAYFNMSSAYVCVVKIKK